MNNALHIDFETRSTVNLPDTGMYVYAEHATTDVWVACYAIGDSPVQIWYPGQACPFAIKTHVRKGLPIYAHNAMFEYRIWAEILTPRYGWPLPEMNSFHCTAAMAAAMALPRDLERACQAMGLNTQKDMDGRRLMLQMARPRSIENGKITWWEVDEKLARLTDYCRTDVLAEQELSKRVRPLRPQEREIWLLDCKINARGIAVDRTSVSQAAILMRRAVTRLNEELACLTNNAVTASSQRNNLVDWLSSQGVDVDSIDKASVLSLQKTELSPTVRRVLEIRQDAAKSSTAKLTAYELRTSKDGRLRETLMYHGASTGRWSGKGVQTQNIPDPSRVGVTPEQIRIAFELLPKMDPELIEIMCGNLMVTLSCMLRGMMVAAHGCKLVSADFSNIEGRVLAWLASESRKIEAFRAFDAGTGPDLYKVAASGIFVVPVDKVEKKQRNVGKVAELACGYQGGVNAFHTMAQGYGIDMTPAFLPLWQRVTGEQQDQLESRYANYNEDTLKAMAAALAGKLEAPTLLTREVWIASEITKQLWRLNNPNIVQFWYDLEESASDAVKNPGKLYPCGKVAFKVHGNVLWCRLPSGRCLSYVDPKIKEITTPWGAKKDAVTFMGINSLTKQWVRQKSYGGLWAENVTQAASRDLLAEAMLRVEKAGYPVVLSVHDELVSEVKADFGSVAEYEALMTQLPDWATGLPIAAEGWEAQRYQK